ncbi:hypothetical protein AB1N83_012056 [Pleurotus pulmonarius]
MEYLDRDLEAASIPLLGAYIAGNGKKKRAGHCRPRYSVTNQVIVYISIVADNLSWNTRYHSTSGCTQSSGNGTDHSTCKNATSQVTRLATAPHVNIDAKRAEKRTLYSSSRVPPRARNTSRRLAARKQSFWLADLELVSRLWFVLRRFTDIVVLSSSVRPGHGLTSPGTLQTSWHDGVFKDAAFCQCRRDTSSSVEDAEPSFNYPVHGRLRARCSNLRRGYDIQSNDYCARKQMFPIPYVNQTVSITNHLDNMYTYLTFDVGRNPKAKPKDDPRLITQYTASSATFKLAARV